MIRKHLKSSYISENGTIINEVWISSFLEVCVSVLEEIEMMRNRIFFLFWHSSKTVTMTLPRTCFPFWLPPTSLPNTPLALPSRPTSQHQCNCPSHCLPPYPVLNRCHLRRWSQKWRPGTAPEHCLFKADGLYKLRCWAKFPLSYRFLLLERHLWVWADSANAEIFIFLSVFA